MARSLGTLTLDLVLQLAGFKQGADRAQREFDQMTRGFRKSASGLLREFRGFGAALGAGLGIAEVVRSTAEAQQAFALLSQAVERNGGAAGRTADELAETSKALQSITTFGDEAIQSAQTLLLSFQSIRGDNFDRATESVLDLATRLGKDLPSAALLVGKALEDPIKGMNQLARAGITFSAEQKKVIEGLVDTGRAAEAQLIVLGRLEDGFKGAAQAARQNFAGALAGLRNQFGELLEADGGLPDATANLNEMTAALADPAAVAAADALTSAILTIGTTGTKVFLELLGPIAELIAEVGDLGATIDKALFGREFSPALERRLFTVHGQIEETREELERLQRVKENQPLLFWFNALNFELATAEKRVASLQNQLSTGPTQRSAAGARRAAQIQAAPLSVEEIDRIDKLADSTRTAREKFEKELVELVRLRDRAFGTANAIDDDTFARAVENLKKELEKPVKTAGLSDAQREIKSAGETVAQFIDRLEEQRDTFGAGEAAAQRYAVIQGEVGKALELLGAKGEEARQKILDLIAVTEQQTAVKAIRDQIEAFEEQAATINLTEAQLVEYQLTHGELARTLAATKEQQSALTEEFRRAAADARAAREEAQRLAEAKQVFEETRTGAEKYAAELQRLRKLLETPIRHADFSVPVPEGGLAEVRIAAPRLEIVEGVAVAVRESGAAAAKAALDFETYGRAVARTVAAQFEAGSAAKDYKDQLAELDRLLAEGVIPNEQAHAAAVEEAGRIPQEARREEAEAFIDEARRATQRITAEFLQDFNFKTLVQDADQAFKEIAANAVSARIAEKLFEGFDTILDSIIDKMGSLFKGGGAGGGGFLASLGSFFAGLFEEGGHIPPGKVGVVGDSRSGRAAPEVIVRGRGRSVLPAHRESFLASLLSVVRPSGKMQLVGTSPDGRERPQLAYGGVTGLTVIPLKNFAGKFAEGGFIPPQSFGMVGDSPFGRTAPELLLAGRVSGVPQQPSGETNVYNVSVPIYATTAGSVSRTTAMQTGNEIARQLQIARLKNG